jgi:DNA-binding HxlR family transcriptional regulator
MITKQRHGEVLRILLAQRWSMRVKEIQKQLPGLTNENVAARVKELAMYGWIEGNPSDVTVGSWVSLNEEGREHAERVMNEQPDPAES